MVTVSDSLTGEHVKQILGEGLQWLAHAIVWGYKALKAIIFTVTEFVAQTIILILQGALQFFKTIFNLLKE